MELKNAKNLGEVERWFNHQCEDGGYAIEDITSQALSHAFQLGRQAQRADLYITLEAAAYVARFVVSEAPPEKKAAWGVYLELINRGKEGLTPAPPAEGGE